MQTLVKFFLIALLIEGIIAAGCVSNVKARELTAEPAGSSINVTILESHFIRGEKYIDTYIGGVAQNVGSSPVSDGKIQLSVYNKDGKNIGGGWTPIKDLDPQEKMDFNILIISLCTAGTNCDPKTYSLYTST